MEIFAIYDRNKDGRIEKSEVARFIRSLFGAEFVWNAQRLLRDGELLDIPDKMDVA